MSPRRKPALKRTTRVKCSWCGARGFHQPSCVSQWTGRVVVEHGEPAGPPAPAWVVWDGVAFLRDDSRSYGALVGVARVWTHDEARARRYPTKGEAARVVVGMRAELVEAFVKAAAP